MTCDDLFDAIRDQPLNGWSCDVGGDFLRLLTPMRYADGGPIELFVEAGDDHFTVTDFGEAFRFLETYGLDPMRSPTRERLIKLAADLGGARIDEGTIEIVAADPSRILEAAIRLAQVVTRVSDLSLDLRSVSGSTFTNVVGEYLFAELESAEIIPRGTLEGRAATHQFDFVVHSLKGVSAIEAMAASTIAGANHQIAFAIKKFADLSALEGAPRRIAVIDDSAGVWTESFREQLGRFANVVDWERRDVLIGEL